MKKVIFVLCLLNCSSVAFVQSSNEILKTEKIFARAIDKGQVEKRLSEASGLVASFGNPKCFWSLNDSGNPAEVFLIDGAAKTKLFLQTSRNKKS